MGLDLWGWTPWALGSPGTRGWTPWGFASSAPLSAAMVQAVAKAQESVLPAGRVKAYAPSKFDDPAVYVKWDFDVRMAMVVVEFLGVLAVEVDHGGKAVTVVGTANGTRKSLLTLTAPTKAEIEAGAEGLNSTQNRNPADSAMVYALVAQNADIDTFMLQAVGALPGKCPAAYELARATSILVNLVCMRLKHAFNVQRPFEIDSSIVPMLPVPGHSSFPGGHATIASALAAVIAAVVPGASADRLGELADEIALNRVRAGLHYELDSIAGRRLGGALAAYLLTLLQTDDGKSAEEQALPLLGEVWRLRASCGQ